MQRLNLNQILSLCLDRFRLNLLGLRARLRFRLNLILSRLNLILNRLNRKPLLDLRSL